MKLRGKFTTLIAIPIVGMIGICLWGIISINFLKNNIEQLDQVQADIASMLNADRDAYQAQRAVDLAAATLDMNTLEEQRDAYEENLQQAEDGILGPSERFTDVMTAQFNRFKAEFANWKQSGDSVVQNAILLADENRKRIEAGREASDQFAVMREQIDIIGINIEEQLAGSLTAQRRRDLEQAQSLVLNGDRDAYQAYTARMEALQAETYEELQEWDASSIENIDQAEERVIQAAQISGGVSAEAQRLFRGYFESWKEASRRTMTLLLDNFQANQDNQQELANSEVSFAAMRDAIDQLQMFQEERTDEQRATMFRVISITISLYLGVVIFMVLVTVAVALILSTTMLRSIKSGITATEKISKGDLTTTVEVKTKDELGTLAETLRGMIDRLKDIMQQIRTASDQVTSGSQQLSTTAEQMSQGATEQASSVEEVSSSMEEMSSNINQNADNATETEKIASQSAQDAEESGKAVMEAVDAMNQIAEKITIIEEIARQTNMLSLNASIEAARAGEHGKGFAVVAAEVGKLAARSKEAAGEISELSTSTVGVAEKAREMLDQLVPNIRKTADLVQEISAASREQSSGADQINTAIGQLDQVIQQNASASEEMASVAEELNSQAEELQNTISFFIIDSGEGRQRSFHSEKKASKPTGEEEKRKPAPKKDEGETGVVQAKKNTKVQNLDSEEFGRF